MKSDIVTTEQPATGRQVSFFGWLMDIHRFGLYMAHGFLEIEGRVCDTTKEACMEWCRANLTKKEMSRLIWMIQSRGPNEAAVWLAGRGAPMVQPADDPRHV